MRKVIFLFLLITGLVSGQDTSQRIKGTVTDGQATIQGVSVLVEGTNYGTSTDAMGRYSISASPKDILVFSYVGMQTVEIIVEDVTQILNIVLYPKVEKLDEVTVTKVQSKRKSQKDLGIEYGVNKNIVSTSYGLINKETSTFPMKVFTGDELENWGTNFVLALNGKYPGLGAGKNELGDDELFIRGGGKPMIYDVDGLIYTIAPTWINLESIDRIAVIPSLGFAIKYGNIGRGGVIIINTKNNNQNYEGLKRNRLNNLYTGDALDEIAVLRNGPTYLKELYASTDSDSAHEVYKKYVPTFGSSYAFVLDAYRCLLDKFSDEKLAGDILKNHESFFEDNPLAIKALAYIHQENRELKKANELYKKLFVKRPNYVQSYLDLASSYREIGADKKAAAIFTRLDYLQDQDYFTMNDTMKVAKLVEREFNNLLALKGDRILSKKEQRNFKFSDTDFKGTRLVFEWNDGEAEFELQFVNPEGRYYKTEHSLFADGDIIREQKLLGYNTEEFLIDDGMSGTWQVNVKYLGNKRLTPSYLKAVVYYNYGTAAQRKETKVFKMGLKDVNRELFTLNVPAAIAN